MYCALSHAICKSASAFIHQTPHNETTGGDAAGIIGAAMVTVDVPAVVVSVRCMVVVRVVVRLLEACQYNMY